MVRILEVVFLIIKDPITKQQFQDLDLIAGYLYEKIPAEIVQIHTDNFIVEIKPVQDWRERGLNASNIFIDEGIEIEDEKH